MYKPRTIDQYKVYRFLSEQFILEHFLISPLSRSALMLEDRNGDKTAFAWQNGAVQEITIPQPAGPEVIKAFFMGFRLLDPKPDLRDFNAITSWWLNHPNPLSYQQALGLPDDLYRHFLSHSLVSDETVRRLAGKQLVSEEEYLDLRLWYRNGHTADCWLGQLGLDGTGNYYGLKLHYRKPEEEEFVFYVMDDYYCYMNQLTQ